VAGGVVNKKDGISIFIFALNMFNRSSIVAAVIQVFLLFHVLPWTSFAVLCLHEDDLNEPDM
jgi:hypothetical protein